MLSSLVIKALNLMLRANPQTQNKFKKLATKLIELKLPLLRLNFIIAPDGSFEPENSVAADCEITIPISSSSYFLHHNQLQAFQNLQISGDKNLAKVFLETLATIDISNILYQHNSPALGILSVKIEKIMRQIIDYAQLINQNASLSTSQYIQYDAQIIVDKYQIDNFCNQVDELKERTDLLALRIERIK